MEFREFLDLANQYFEERIQGTSYEAIQQVLQDKNIEEEDIQKILFRIKRMELRHTKKQDGNQKSLRGLLRGILITGVGLYITLSTYYSDLKFYIIAYGAIFSGIGMIAYSLAKYRK